MNPEMRQEEAVASLVRSSSSRDARVACESIVSKTETKSGQTHALSSAKEEEGGGKQMDTSNPTQVKKSSRFGWLPHPKKSQQNQQHSQNQGHQIQQHSSSKAPMSRVLLLSPGHEMSPSNSGTKKAASHHRWKSHSFNKQDLSSFPNTGSSFVAHSGPIPRPSVVAHSGPIPRTLRYPNTGKEEHEPTSPTVTCMGRIKTRSSSLERATTISKSKHASFFEDGLPPKVRYPSASPKASKHFRWKDVFGSKKFSESPRLSARFGRLGSSKAGKSDADGSVSPKSLVHSDGQTKWGENKLQFQRSQNLSRGKGEFTGVNSGADFRSNDIASTSNNAQKPHVFNSSLHEPGQGSKPTEVEIWKRRSVAKPLKLDLPNRPPVHPNKPAGH